MRRAVPAGILDLELAELVAPQRVIQQRRRASRVSVNARLAMKHRQAVPVRDRCHGDGRRPACFE